MEETVYCQIAGAEVPPDVCDKEQGGSECRGCVAPTRRCTRCKQTRPIAEPKSGLCRTCASTVPQEPERMRLSVADALEEVATAMSNPHPPASGWPSQARPTTDIPQEVVDAINALPPMQRTVLTLRLGLDGNRPCTIVKTCVRANLSQTNVNYATREALEALIGQIGESQIYRLRQMMPGSKYNRLRQMMPGSKYVPVRAVVRAVPAPPSEPSTVDNILVAIRSLPTRQAECMRLRLGIGTAHSMHKEDVARSMKVSVGTVLSTQYAALETLRRVMTPDAYERMVQMMPRKRPGRQPAAAAPAPLPAPQGEASAAPEQHAAPPAPAGNTLGDVYAYLLRRAVVIGDERVVRGTVTFLQIDCGLWKDEVVAILQKLESQGAIEARDGWRTVVLKADAVESTDIVVQARRGRFGRSTGPAILPPAVPAAVTADMNRLKQELLRVQDERTSLTARLEKLEEQPKQAGESDIRASVDKLDARLVNLETLLGDLVKKMEQVAAPSTSASQDAPPAQGRMVVVEDPVVRLADEDGFFEAGGEWWGHISGLEKRLGIPMPTLYSRIRTDVIRVRRGRSCKGKRTQFFAASDVERACADLLGKKGAGAAPRAGRPPEFATTGKLMKRFKVGIWTLQSRIDAGVRTQNGRTASGGPATLYCVSDVERVLAPILRLPVAASGGITRRGVRYESIRVIAVQFKQHESSVGAWIRKCHAKIRSVEGRTLRGQIRTFYAVEDAKRLLMEQVSRQFS